MQYAVWQPVHASACLILISDHLPQGDNENACSTRLWGHLLGPAAPNMTELELRKLTLAPAVLQSLTACSGLARLHIADSDLGVEDTDVAAATLTPAQCPALASLTLGRWPKLWPRSSPPFHSSRTANCTPPSWRPCSAQQRAWLRFA